MRLILIFAALIFGQSAMAKIIPVKGLASGNCNLAETATPDCFKARLTPTVKAVLVAYGENTTAPDLSMLGKLLVERFNSVTDGSMTLEIVDQALIPLKNYPRDLTEIRNAIPGPDSQRTDARLTRLWYYYNMEYEKLVEEIHGELIQGGMRPALEAADTVLVLSAPQFEGLGYAHGGFGLTEQPSEIAWLGTDGGRTSFEPNERLVDELLHEIGHVLGLDHASARCFEGGMSGQERMQCCAQSPGRSDVMSYCRDRSRVQGPYYFRYTTCTKQYLREVVRPALINGGPRVFQPVACD